MIEVLVVRELSSGLSVPKRQNNDLKGQRNLNAHLWLLWLRCWLCLSILLACRCIKDRKMVWKDKKTLNAHCWLLWLRCWWCLSILLAFLRQKDRVMIWKNKGTLIHSPLALVIEVLVVPEHASGLSVPKRQNNDLNGERYLKILTLGFDLLEDALALWHPAQSLHHHPFWSVCRLGFPPQCKHINYLNVKTNMKHMLWARTWMVLDVTSVVSR